jgi:hypothetical protein
MKYEDFIVKIWETVDSCPKEWRKGQKVFNVCDELFGGTARDVQFIDGIDCFYEDKYIDNFINAVWERLNDDNN